MKTFDQRKPSRIVFVNRFFHPDISATSQLLSQLAFALAEQGWPVTIITGRSAYDDNRIVFDKREIINDVDVIRVGKTHFRRTNYLGRLFDVLGFYVVLTFALLRTVTDSDIIICKTDPPLLVVLTAVIKKIKKCRLISWNQDIFPEIAYSYFQSFSFKLVFPLIKRARTSALRHCDDVIVISHAMQLKMKAFGIDNATVISNWGPSLQADQQKINDLKRAWEIDNHFIVEYSGNFGFVHEYETLKQVIEQLKSDRQVVFLFIGSGRYYESLQRLAGKHKLSQLVFKPYQPAEHLAESLSVADMHLITFRPDMEGLVFPSKFYGICSVAKPILFIGDREGELGELINRQNCGASFDVGQSNKIVDYILDCKRSRTHLSQQGENAQALFKEHYNFDVTLKKWNSLLNRYIDQS